MRLSADSGTEPVIVKAKYAGSGKSYRGVYEELRLMFCSSALLSSLCKTPKTDATTKNTFFAAPKKRGWTKECPHSACNCIVFDEVGVSGMYVLSRTRQKDASERIIVGTADGKQLPPDRI